MCTQNWKLVRNEIPVRYFDIKDIYITLKIMLDISSLDPINFEMIYQNGANSNKKSITYNLITILMRYKT